MNNESFDQFNFNIPEKGTNNVFVKLLVFLLIIIFSLTPLAKIDSNTFKYNTANIHSYHDCSGINHLLISCQ